MFLQKHALLLAASSIYTTNLYHDTAPTCIAKLLQKYQGQGLFGRPPQVCLLDSTVCKLYALFNVYTYYEHSELEVATLVGFLRKKEGVYFMPFHGFFSTAETAPQLILP